MSELFANEPSQQELNERAAAAVTVYGVGTRSYNRSAEKREMDKQRAAATERFESRTKSEALQPLICTCRSFLFAHSPARHRSLKHEADWTPWEDRYWFDKRYNCWTEKKNSDSGGLKFYEVGE